MPPDLNLDLGDGLHMRVLVARDAVAASRSARWLPLRTASGPALPRLVIGGCRTWLMARLPYLGPRKHLM